MWASGDNYGGWLDVNNAVLQLTKRIDEKVATLGKRLNCLPGRGGFENCDRRILTQIALDVRSSPEVASATPGVCPPTAY